MGAESGLMRHATRAFVQIVATVVVAYAIATAVRYGLVERDDLGSICQSAASPWWCDLRMLVIRGFLNDAFGRASGDPQQRGQQHVGDRGRPGLGDAGDRVGDGEIVTVAGNRVPSGGTVAGGNVLAGR